MDVAPGKRFFGQPEGGFYTAPLLTDGTSAWVVFSMSMWIENLNRHWWLMTPDPQAPVLVLTTANDFERAGCAFRYRDCNELDFEALAAAGFAAVHTTTHFPGESKYGGWLAGETCWLYWAFPGAATLVEGSGADADADQPLRLGPRRLGLPPPWEDQSFVVMLPPPQPVKDVLLQEAQRASGPWDPFGGQAAFDALLHALLDHAIVQHTFTDAKGRRLPVGPGFSAALHAPDHELCRHVWRVINAEYLKLKAQVENLEALGPRITTVLPAQLSLSGRVASGKVRAAGVDLICDLVTPAEGIFPEGFGGARIMRYPIVDYWPYRASPLPPESG